MRKRRGNLILTMMVVSGALLMIASLLSMTTAQRLRARNTAEKAGDIASYIAIANLCADAFRDDLESQFADMPVVTVENIDGTQMTFVDYEEMLGRMQKALMETDDPDEEGAVYWTYVLSDPEAPMEYSGLDSAFNADFVAYHRELLRNAGLEIRVDAPLGIAGATVHGGEIAYNSDDKLYLNDICYTVTLEKGTMRLTQKYRLTGEYIQFNYLDTSVHGSISGDRAQNILEEQQLLQNVISSAQLSDLRRG